MKNNLQYQLEKKIQLYRKAQGFSQEKFAECIGIATNTLSSIETGNAFMTAQTLEKILEILNITPTELFNFSLETKNVDMYGSIIEKLNLIKTDKSRLEILYKLVNSLL